MENTSGSVTDTKQFIWQGLYRREERNAFGVLGKKFFARGQINGSTKYFCTKDHQGSRVNLATRFFQSTIRSKRSIPVTPGVRNGSVRELVDEAGAIQSQLQFDPYGQVNPISEDVPSDFQYSGYYIHKRSQLYLTKTRAYNATIGRWIGRDRIEELGGINLYSYCANNPLQEVDPNGTSISEFHPNWAEWWKKFCEWLSRFIKKETDDPPPPPPSNDDEGGNNQPDDDDTDPGAPPGGKDPTEKKIKKDDPIAVDDEPPQIEFNRKE